MSDITVQNGQTLREDANAQLHHAEGIGIEGIGIESRFMTEGIWFLRFLSG